jgi:DNA gyrase subunit A
MSIRFDENDARVMGRDAAGVIGIDLADDDRVVGLVRCDDTACLFTCTESGFGKRTPMTEYLVHQEDGTTRVQSRGGKGRIDIQTGGRNGSVVAVHCVHESDQLLFISRGGMVVRIRASDVRLIGRNTKGVRVVKLQDADALMAAARFEGGVDDSPTDAPADAADDAGGPAPGGGEAPETGGASQGGG